MLLQFTEVHLWQPGLTSNNSGKCSVIGIEWSLSRGPQFAKIENVPEAFVRQCRFSKSRSVTCLHYQTWYNIKQARFQKSKKINRDATPRGGGTDAIFF